MPTTAQAIRAQTATQAPTASPATTPAASTAAPSTPTRIVNPAPPVVSLGTAAPKPAVTKASKPLPKGAGPGQPLAPGVQSVLETRLGVDLSAVRVHTEQVSAAAVGAVSARAFTRGTDIFLGRGERATDIALLAHEVAHVVQQQGAPRTQPFTTVGGDALENEAQRASSAVSRGEPFTVRERTTGARVQRWGVSDALNRFADLANMIPGYRMFTIVLGVNPINMSAVERSAANIMRAVVEFIPGGGLVTRALDSYGVFDRVGGWVEGQIRSLGMTGGAIRQALMEFVGSLSLSDIFDLGGVWERARRIFTEPISRIISFARGLITGILGFLREAVLRPLAQLAQGTRGYDLLKAVLGQDPVTGEAVPRNADTLIGGFMKLIGQEEVWNNLKRANAVARAWAWFQGALSGLMGFVRQVPGLIVSTLRSIVIEDLLPLTNLFVKVGRAFGGFFGSFLSWAGGQVMSLLQIIFEVVAPGVMPYIRRAAGAFTTIIRNPIGFVGNLVRAGVQGFRQFAGNFLNHLRASLISWLTGTMSGAGVYIPQAFSLMEIIKFVLSVLGLTWQNIRGKLVRAVGETAVRAMEVGFDIVRTLVTEGPAAAWQKILEGITNLREMVMEQVMTFVRERVVQAAITRLLTSLNPAGAFIQAIVAVYNTVMFFVERMRQIAQVVAAYIDSISAIAAGNIGAAANRVETTMAGLLTLVISFLARIAGLGRVSDAVVNIINRVRAPVDRALDRVVDWIRDRAQSFMQRAAGGTPQQRLERALAAGQAAVNRFAGRRVGAIVLTPLLGAIRLRFQLQSLDVVQRGQRWAVRGAVNPTGEVGTEAQAGEGTPGTGDARQLAEGLLRQRLQDDMDEPAITSTLSGILGELRSQGLTQLEYRFVLETGELEFVAAASPPRALFNRFFVRARRRPYAQLAVTMRSRGADLRQGLRYTGRPAMETLSYPSQMRRGANVPNVTERIGVSSSAFVPGQGAAGNVVVSSTTRGDILQMVAWNTNTRNNRDSGGSHAETQFMEWFDHQSQEWRESVGRVVLNINVSPCTNCANALVGWAARYPWITVRLTWGRRYPGTTDADIAALSRFR